MTSIKEFARIENISYEAVRQQIKRYENELQGHLFKEGRTRYLDDWAMDFLREKKKKNPIIIQQYDHAAEIEQLKLEKEQLLMQLNLVQNQLIESQKLLLEKTEENSNLKIQLLESGEKKKEEKKRWWRRT